MPDIAFRILDFNYIFQPTVSLTASSEDAAFPVENISHFHRSKMWHSTGTFVISSSNRKIDFDIGGGAVVATLTTGTYTPTALAAEIVTQLNATAAGTYTCSYSTSTGKWTITKSAGTLSLLWNTGANTANGLHTTIGFSSAADSTGALTYTGANIAIHTEERVVFDLGSAEEIDSFAILFDRFLGHGFTDSAVLKLQANASAVWTAPSVDVTLSLDETYDIVTRFVSTAEEYRYWSIKIVDPANPNLYVSLPTVFLSKATQLGQVPQIGWEMGNTDLSESVKTKYGHRYSDIYPSLRYMNFIYEFLAQADVQTLVEIKERLGSVTPLMVCLDPLATVFDKDRFALYGYLAQNDRFRHSFYTYFGSGLSIEEAA